MKRLHSNRRARRSIGSPALPPGSAARRHSRTQRLNQTPPGSDGRRIDSRRGAGGRGRVAEWTRCPREQEGPPERHRSLPSHLAGAAPPLHAGDSHRPGRQPHVEPPGAPQGRHWGHMEATDCWGQGRVQAFKGGRPTRSGYQARRPRTRSLHSTPRTMRSPTRWMPWRLRRGPRMQSIRRAVSRRTP